MELIVCKISLSCFDDKRYILDNGTNSLAHFHKDVQSQNVNTKLFFNLYGFNNVCHDLVIRY